MERDVTSNLENVPLNDNGVPYGGNHHQTATMGGTAIFNPMGPTFPSTPSPVTNQQSNAREPQRPTSLPPYYPNSSAARHSVPNTATTPVTPSSITSPMSENGAGLMRSNHSKMDSLKTWSISTYKCTKQLLSEKLGKSSRTVDTELEGRIEALRDTQRKYSQILRLARALSSHFYHVVQTQQQLGDAFADLSQKSPELQEEFIYNAETQRSLTKNGETLLSALNFFVSSVNTLCNKTMEDTLLTIKQFEQARIEYDAYRTDLETLSQQPRAEVSSIKLEECQMQFNTQKTKYDSLRADVAVKLKFLEENKVKVMHKQLLLFHNAISAYFTGNQAALEATLKQFNIKMLSPNASPPSWLEQSVPETFHSIFGSLSTSGK